MSLRAPLVLVLASIIPSMGAAFRTTNFVVEAPTAQIAEQVGQWAEYYRKEKAIQWIGQEMPNWPDLLQLHGQLHLADHAHRGTARPADRQRAAA
ncbi:MAG: hypothetical protein E6K70_23300 [Planctomycetota bacterium]|nr:MAG: hypothetical protein E6K70_23300 [Planctomycetota bacterium]